MRAFILLVVLIAALALAAFCAGAETGFLSLSRGRVLHMARAGSRKAKRLQKALLDMPRTTTTLLLGNNLAAVIYSSCSAALCDIAFPESAALHAFLSIIAATAMLYMGEFLPQIFYSARPLRRALRISGAYRTLATGLKPVVAPFNALLSCILPKETRTKLSPDELLRILKDKKDGVKLSDLESVLIARIMTLRAKGAKVTPETLLSVLDED